MSTPKPAIEHFVTEVQRIIDRFRYEYELNYAEMVGALVFIIRDLANEDDVSTTEDTQNDH